MTSNKQKFLEWLEYESKEAHDAEIFSRNGESIDFDSGVFAGREEAFNEVIVKINQDEEIMKCSYCDVLTSEDAKKFNDYMNSPRQMNNETKEMIKQANELVQTLCLDSDRKQRNEKIIKEKLLKELKEFVISWYSKSNPKISECYIDKGVMIAKLEEMYGGVIYDNDR